MITHCVGAIELSILSESYETELHVVDIQTNRIDKFGKCSIYVHIVCDCVVALIYSTTFEWKISSIISETIESLKVTNISVNIPTY